MIEGLALQVAQNFRNVSEQQIAELEQKVIMTAPNSLECHLLYALRVSRCVPGLRNLDTLASRWGVARRGAGGMGLDAATTSPDWSAIVDFLIKLYLEKFREMAQRTVTMAIEKAAKRKSEAAKQKVLEKGVATLIAARNAFRCDLPSLDQETQGYIQRIEEVRQS
ncbi:MAG: hypothetical protein E6J54_28360 [Deltaproteobacteria bacterium]|nr:MAG: hypothetical protein DME76_07040 [Verrucomicrobiota bacterium]TMB64304.1 MAG: hypothetical protein E6J54_28360 [Deltaproteobacteria bacterium]